MSTFCYPIVKHIASDVNDVATSRFPKESSHSRSGYLGVASDFVNQLLGMHLLRFRPHSSLPTRLGFVKELFPALWYNLGDHGSKEIAL